MRYEAVTGGIRVTVEPHFLEEKSEPAQGRYFWAYTVEITNLSQVAVQLRTRYWRIMDALGRTQEVRGPGVVGEEPVIPPGGSFEYTSGCPLTTSSGFMVGNYVMDMADGGSLTVDIPAFSLDTPAEKRVVN
jgi:ApaG protein